MPRVTYVKKAQQRYYTEPVLDENGQPAYSERTLKRPTKRGKTVVRTRLTKADKSRPKPNLHCDFAGCQHPNREIAVGQAYKWIKPKSGPYGGSMRARHAEHPSWHVWEYSQSLSARIQEIQHQATEALSADFEGVEDVEAVLTDIAENVRGLAEEKREGASNIEEGFGHETSQSEELNSIADELDSWADEIESADIPEYPSKRDLPEEEWDDCAECEGEGTRDVGCADCMGSGVIEDAGGNVTGDCPTCDGSGQVEEQCTECDGSGKQEPTDEDDPTEEQIDTWRSEVEDAVTIVDESPV